MNKKDKNIPEEIVIEQLVSTNLNTVNEYKRLYPHWEKTKLLKKINDTLKGKDKRIIAKKNGHIIGQVRLKEGKGIHSHRTEITSLIVLPYERGQGLGKAIMNYAISKAPKGKELFLLAVDSKNSVAINLYKQLGFKKYGLLKKGSKIQGKYTDNVLMEKRI